MFGFWVAGQATRQPDQNAYASIMQVAKLPVWLTMGSNNNNSCDTSCDGCSEWGSDGCWNELKNGNDGNKGAARSEIGSQGASEIGDGLDDLKFTDTGRGIDSSDLSIIKDNLEPSLAPFQNEFDSLYDFIRNGSPHSASKDPDYSPIFSYEVSTDLQDIDISWNIGGTMEERWDNLIGDFLDEQFSSTTNGINGSTDQTYNLGGGSWDIQIGGDISYDTGSGDVDASLLFSISFKF